MRHLWFAFLLVFPSAANAQDEETYVEDEYELEEDFFITQPLRERLEDPCGGGGRVEQRRHSRCGADDRRDRDRNIGAGATPNIPGAAGTPNIPGAGGTPIVPGAGSVIEPRRRR